MGKQRHSGQHQAEHRGRDAAGHFLPGPRYEFGGLLRAVPRLTAAGELELLPTIITAEVVSSEIACST